MAPRARLTKERIARAALELGDKEGLEVISMRRIATALGTAPMTLYHHYPNKDALLDAMAELVFNDGVRVVEPASTALVERLEALLTSYRNVLLAHPALAPLLAQRAVTNKASLEIRNDIAAHLIEAGFQGADLARAYSTAMGYTIGFTLAQVHELPVAPVPEPTRTTVRLGYQALRDQGYEALAAVSDRWWDQDPDALFQWGLRRLLAGLLSYERATPKLHNNQAQPERTPSADNNSAQGC